MQEHAEEVINKKDADKKGKSEGRQKVAVADKILRWLDAMLWLYLGAVVWNGYGWMWGVGCLVGVVSVDALLTIWQMARHEEGGVGKILERLADNDKKAECSIEKAYTKIVGWLACMKCLVCFGLKFWFGLYLI